MFVRFLSKFITWNVVTLFFVGFLGRAADLPAVYVWQRAWTPQVCDSVQQHAASFSQLIVLQREIAWKNSAPQIVHVPINYNCLRSVADHCPVGFAIRIGMFGGPFSKTDQTTQILLFAINAMIQEARTNQLEISELQTDFDCAESKLIGYREWIDAIHSKFAPLRIVITALPTWLDHPDFANLAKSTDGFVLQVHSFERPKNFETPFTLCDPAKARKALEKAASLGIPFRVALPTYGYTVAFDGKGTFVGLSAEGRAKTWPANVRTREVRADAEEMAKLVASWNTHPPKNYRGIIWYRLPIEGDLLNWKWPTFQTVMEGRVPKGNLNLKVQKPEKGLVEIRLQNNGDNDLSLTDTILIKCPKTKLLAADALRGFEFVDTHPETVQFRPRQFFPSLTLRPGDECFVGWLRFSQETEVQCEILSK